MRAVALASLIVAVTMLPPDSIAKPRRIVSNGCTAEQIQSPSASSCIDKMESDILANRSTIHAVYCSSTGKILCCEYDSAGAVVDHSCTVVGLRRPPASTTGPLTNGGVLLAPQ